MLKKTFACTLVPVVSLLLLTLAGEVCLRVYHFLKEGMPIERWPEYLVGHNWTTTLDDELGWKATENYRLIRQEETAEGKPYDLRLSQDAQGFRQFGNVASKKPKIFVIGDSFTQAREVSDGKPYYAIVGQRLDAEMFAYGVENYGTLQELMVLDRYLDWIQPDVIVWQWCSNDFANNDPELDSARPHITTFGNVHTRSMRRSDTSFRRPHSPPYDGGATGIHTSWCSSSVESTGCA